MSIVRLKRGVVSVEEEFEGNPLEQKELHRIGDLIPPVSFALAQESGNVAVSVLTSVLAEVLVWEADDPVKQAHLIGQALIAAVQTNLDTVGEATH
jgi:hypothetical protein